MTKLFIFNICLSYLLNKKTKKKQRTNTYRLKLSLYFDFLFPRHLLIFSWLISRSNMQKLSELFKDRPMTALDTAVYWVEYVARHGYILQSSAVHLNVFQQNLLDVYGFMLLCVVTVLYLVILLIRKAKNFVFGHKSCLFKKNQSKQEESKKTNWILF